MPFQIDIDPDFIPLIKINVDTNMRMIVLKLSWA